MEGWKQLCPRLPNGLKLVMLAMPRCLGKILPKICISEFEVTLLKATFSLAFSRAFCCSELVAGSKGDAIGRALAVTDIIIEGSELNSLAQV